MSDKMIQVIGSSCPNCKIFFSTVQQIISDSQINASVEYIDDIEKIIKLGIMTSPALLVDGEIILTGNTHSIEEIKNAILETNVNKNLDNNNQVTCSCCTKC